MRSFKDIALFTRATYLVQWPGNPRNDGEVVWFLAHEVVLCGFVQGIPNCFVSCMN